MKEKGFAQLFLILTAGVIIAIVSGFLVFQRTTTPKQAPISQGATKISPRLSSAVALAKEDLAKRLGASQGSISVVSQEEVEWPDASLGCPKEGVVYAQVITPGYKIVLSRQGKNYSYHGALNQKPFLCEKEDETANWKIYKNQADGYSFMIPPDWDTLELGGGTLMVAPKKNVDEVREIKGGFGGGPFLTVLINKSSELTPLKSDKSSKVNESAISIDSRTAKKYEVIELIDGPHFEAGSKWVDIEVKNRNYYLSIELVDYNQVDTFDQILSTFRFID